MGTVNGNWGGAVRLELRPVSGGARRHTDWSVQMRAFEVGAADH